MLYDIISQVNPALAGTFVFSLFENALLLGHSVLPADVVQVIRHYSERIETRLAFARAFLHPRTPTITKGLERGRIIAQLTVQCGGLVTGQLISLSVLSNKLANTDDDEVASMAFEAYPYLSFNRYVSLLQHLSGAVVSNIMLLMRVKLGLKAEEVEEYTCFAA